MRLIICVPAECQHVDEVELVTTKPAAKGQGKKRRRVKPIRKKAKLFSTANLLKRHYQRHQDQLPLEWCCGAFTTELICVQGVPRLQPATRQPKWSVEARLLHAKGLVVQVLS
jgi:hypothetical protein